MRRGTAVLLGVFGVVGALLVAGFVTRAVAMDAKTYRIPSEAMIPTVQAGDRVTLNRGAYDDAAPEIGDVVIHRPPASAAEGTECGGEQPDSGRMCARPSPQPADTSFIKRVVAGPGDRVALREGRVVLDGEPQREPYIKPCEGGRELRPAADQLLAAEVDGGTTSTAPG